ncbi:MAG: hypothetical protein ACYCPR_06915 [Thermoplasmataceae archaeon]
MADETNKEATEKGKKVSLYFKPETMLELTRLKDMLILTGIPSSKLPDMHSMINGTIKYQEKILQKYPIDRERFKDYLKGQFRPTNRELKKEEPVEEEKEETEEYEKIDDNRINNETGRFLFKIQEGTKESLEQIKKYLSNPITDPFLIRALIEFTLLEKIDKFTAMSIIYTGALYGLEPATAISLITNEKLTKEGLEKITKEEREKLRRIEFDRKSIEILEDGIREHKKFKENKVIYNNPYKKRRYGIYTSTYNKIVKQTQSKANSFNYTLAHIGYIVMIEMIYENIESITQAIIQIQKISKHPAIQDIEYIKKLLEASMLLNNTPEIL